MPQHTSNDLSLPQVSSFQSLQTTTALIIFPHLSSLLVTSTQHTSPNLSSLIFTTLHLASNNFTLFLFQKPNLTPFYLTHLFSINPPYHILPSSTLISTTVCNSTHPISPTVPNLIPTRLIKLYLTHSTHLFLFPPLTFPHSTLPQLTLAFYNLIKTSLGFCFSSSTLLSLPIKSRINREQITMHILPVMYCF